VPGLGDGPDLTRPPDPIPAELGSMLPAPVMSPPLRGCDPSVGVSGVFDGAQVTIRNGGGVEMTAGFDLSALSFVLPVALSEGDELVIRQQFQQECQRIRSSWSAPAMPVGPASPVDPPVPCRGPGHSSAAWPGSRHCPASRARPMRRSTNCLRLARRLYLLMAEQLRLEKLRKYRRLSS